MEDKLPHKLAAILYADVADYSRLTGEDEDATHRRLSEYLDLVSNSIGHHQGKVVHYAGDAVLADFSTVTNALECATSIQNDLSNRNQDLPDERKIQFRIGINLGEVIVDRDDIYGNDVNVAARLESLADAGGICISDAVRTAIGNKLPIAYEFMGEQSVKNIKESIRAYRVRRSSEEQLEESVSKLPVFELSEKPSIAVLPFTNMSDDPEQEYFSDGITEDIITGLSRFHTLFVIARNSTFAYKGQSVKVQDVGRDLGVQYVAKGSVRKSNRRVRVTAQLVEGETGNHIWAEHYDRNLEDIFDVQDEITEAIVSTLPGRLEDAGWQRAKRKQTANMTAYDYLLLGLERFNRFSQEDNLQARRMFEAAIDSDPAYARAHALLAWTYIEDLYIYAESDQTLDRAFKSAKAALELDYEDGRSHAILGLALFLRGQDEEAEIHFQHAISQNPNDADVIALIADALIYFGRWKEGLEYILKAKHLNPFPPGYYHWYHALALYSAHEFEQAILAIKTIRSLDRWHHGLLAMCYAQVNRLDEASSELAIFVDKRRKEIRERDVSVSIRDLDLVSERVNRYRTQADREHFLDGLRKAGLNV